MDAAGTIQFILENQAKFSSDLIEMNEHIKAIDRALDRVTVKVEQLADRAGQTQDQLGQLTARTGRLEAEMEKLAESQRHTGERLNALIAVVDQMVRRDRK